MAENLLLLLLVEDEALIRMDLEDALTEAGFDLVVATSGQQALAEIETDPARFDAVVTDIRLGRGPDGWEIARRSRELVPTMSVVYVSGDSAYEWAARGVPRSVMVAKPFVAAQVINAVSTLLNQSDSH